MSAKSRKLVRRGRKQGRGETIKLVVKSNELVEARYMFDVWETRFFLSLIAMIDKNDEDEKIYRLWFKDIKTNFKLKSNQSYSYLREAAQSMASKSVYIGWMNDEFRRGRMHRIIRFVDFLEKGQEGQKGVGQQEYVDVSIDKNIKPYLLDIKKNYDPKTTRYTSYDLRNVIKLKSYGMRIYELLKQFEYAGSRTIAVQDLKDMFEITNEYPRFSNFYQKVIKASVDSINRYTDLRIPSVEKVKQGRRVAALRFIIESKSDKEVSVLMGERDLELFDYVDDDAAEPIEKYTPSDILFNEFEEVVVRSFGVTPSTFIKMMNSGKYTKEAIEQAISVTRRAKYQQQIKSNVAGFFIKALKEGFTDVKEEAKKKQTREKQRESISKELRSLKEQLSTEINNRIREITEKDERITIQVIKTIREDALTGGIVIKKEEELGRNLEIEDFRKDGQLRVMVITGIVAQQKAHFEDIYARMNPEIKELSKRLDEMS
jgi:plasmid replication initiation protein